MNANSTIALGNALVGFRGRIRELVVDKAGVGLPGPELERRLIELGFVEGADVELLHQGLFGGDPIAVRVAHTTIVQRRRRSRKPPPPTRGVTPRRRPHGRNRLSKGKLIG